MNRLIFTACQCGKPCMVCEMSVNIQPSEMTDSELYKMSWDSTCSPDFIKICIREENRRLNESVQRCLREGRNAGAD